jgi:hypothetical protein
MTVGKESTFSEFQKFSLTYYETVNNCPKLKIPLLLSFIYFYLLLLTDTLMTP